MKETNIFWVPILYYKFCTMKIQVCHLTWFLKKKKVIQVDITSIVIFIWTDKNSDKFDQGQVAGGGSLI